MLDARRLALLDARTRAGKGWMLDAELLAPGELGGHGLLDSPWVSLTPRSGIGAVLYTDRQDAGATATFISFPDLLSASDVISLHVPLTAETTGMMNERAFARMKPGAILVNTARGGLVDYQALHHALATGHLGGAGLDVFDAEPAGASHAMFGLRNVVVTPHLAWFTAETLGRSLGVFVENCRRLREGEPLLHRVV
jgi:phosphoglycerate dehydrogenase-like enzyme